MGKKITDMIGRKFGRWLVIGESSERNSSGDVRYLCKCDCGNEKTVSGTSLRQGKTTSCGCYNREIITKGYRFSEEKLYSVWSAMRQRCGNPHDKAYKNYGGRGIRVCNEWSNYQVFREWALNNGYKHGLWLDRIDNNSDYSPNNCRWATTKEQARNKRISVMLTIGGTTKNIADWADCSGVGVATIRRRIELGWDNERLLDPIDKRLSHGEAIRAFYHKT